MNTPSPSHKPPTQKPPQQKAPQQPPAHKSPAQKPPTFFMGDNTERKFLQNLKDQPITLSGTDGQTITGILRAFGAYNLLIELTNGQQLLYLKHAIRYITAGNAADTNAYQPQPR